MRRFDQNDFTFAAGHRMTQHRKQFSDLMNRPDPKVRSPIRMLDVQAPCDKAEHDKNRETDIPYSLLTPTRAKIKAGGGENSNRKREFDLRVKNIEKMNEKIQSLLECVGGTRGKSALNERSQTPTIKTSERSNWQKMDVTEKPNKDKNQHLQKSHNYSQWDHNESTKRQKRTQTNEITPQKIIHQTKNTTQGDRCQEVKLIPEQKIEYRGQRLTNFGFQRSRQTQPTFINRSNRVKRNYDCNQGKEERVKEQVPIPTIKRQISSTNINIKKDTEKQKAQTNIEKTPYKTKKNYLAMLQAKTFVQEESPKNNNHEAFKLKVYPIIMEQCLQSSSGVSNYGQKEETCKKIAQILVEQIKHDKKLRCTKEAFSQVRDEEKWEHLQTLLRNHGYQLTFEQLRTQMMMSENESDPFEDINSCGNDWIDAAASAWVQSIKYWEHKLQKCCSRQQINASGFEPSQLDLTGKGYLTTEDLVCFINLYSSNYFRNRDLICIMRRLKNSQEEKGVSYKNFLQKIAH